MKVFNLGIRITGPRIDNGTSKDFCISVKGITVEIGSIVERLHRLKQLGSKEIKNRLGVRMISVFWRVTPHED